jgi:hypothetical protein
MPDFMKISHGSPMCHALFLIIIPLNVNPPCTSRASGTQPAAKPVAHKFTSLGQCHPAVIYTRPAPGGRLIRRRECRHCGKRFMAYERAVG